ncbi:MAG: hypothetical protein KatS3mg061_0292 [Dehalococcoidia bacterium]|nr:MAG: hypothetical protein KatS3mg061_0292 [Dehalococcoidia bacterium]
MDSQNGRVVLLIDYDNFEICVRRDLQMVADLAPVVAYAQSLGTIVAARAYGSWDDPATRMMVYRTGVEPAFAPVFPAATGQQGAGKSVADTALVADGVDLLHLLRPDYLVVVSSDKDLMPLVRMARLRGTQVIVVGSDYTAAQLAQSADRLVTYRELVGGPRQRGVPMPRGQQPLVGPVQPTFKTQPIAPASSEVPLAGEPVSSGPEVTSPEGVPAPTKRRRRRRRGRSESTAPPSEPGAARFPAADLPAVEVDLAEAINEADELAAAPSPPPPPPGPRLPFRRPEVIARLASQPPRPEPAARPEPAPRPVPPAPADLPTAPPLPPLPIGAVTEGSAEELIAVRPGEPPIGPIRAAAEPPRVLEPEEPVVATPALPEEAKVIRPPLEALLGQVIVRELPDPIAQAPPPETSPLTAAPLPVADPSLAVEAQAASGAPAATSRRRRRRRGAASSNGITEGAPITPALDPPATVLLESAPALVEPGAAASPEPAPTAEAAAPTRVRARGRRHRSGAPPAASTPAPADPTAASAAPAEESVAEPAAGPSATGRRRRR